MGSGVWCVFDLSPLSLLEKCQYRPFFFFSSFLFFGGYCGCISAFTKNGMHPWVFNLMEKVAFFFSLCKHEFAARAYVLTAYGAPEILFFFPGRLQCSFPSPSEDRLRGHVHRFKRRTIPRLSDNNRRPLPPPPPPQQVEVAFGF